MRVHAFIEKGGGEMGSEQQTVMYVAHYELEGGPNSITELICTIIYNIYNNTCYHCTMPDCKPSLFDSFLHEKKIILLCLS